MPDQHNNTDGFIPTHGGYQNLLSYQKAEIVYDGTKYFTERFLSKYDRTVDQMVQAARSGKQNIAEGSAFSATSKELEIKLTNAAYASQVELLDDYKDFLRTNKLQIWDKNSRLVNRLLELNKTPGANYQTFVKAIEHQDPEICANTMVTLVNITIYLIKQQVKALEEAFIKEGGIRERMTRARINYRNKQ